MQVDVIKESLAALLFPWPFLSKQQVLFCFVLFSLKLSVCLWWHDYRRDDLPTLKFGVVIGDLLAIW